MKINKILPLFFFQLLLLTTVTFASNTHFNFSLPSIFLKQGIEYSMSLSYLLDGINEKDFIVIPNAENSLLEIYNDENKSWVKQNEFRSNFPRLKPTMKIKLISFAGVSTKVCFDVQLLKTSEVYKTPCRTYWNAQHFLKYIDAVNAKIFEWVKGKG